ERLQRDIFDRRLEDTIPSDLYIAGFPCPAYSSCGKKLGARDGLRRGLLLFEGLKYIAYWKPRVVILEQIQGFLDKKHAKTHKAMRKFFAALSYIVYMKKLSTKEHGVPQSRCRCYFVAFLRTAKKQQFHFRFTKSIACPTLKSFLDTDRLGSEKAPLPFYEEKHGPNIWKEGTVLDIGASAKWQSKMNNLCPCLIRTRCLQKGYYLPKQLRRLDGVECARFQGIPAAIFEKMMAAVQRKTSFSTPEAAEKQVMGALGDSMSISVLMRLLPAALQAGSLWPSNLERQDPWKQRRTADLADLSDRLFEAANVSLEEKSRLREDERKRLTRLVQQAKHDQSLVKQSKAGTFLRPKQLAGRLIQDYYECLKQDLAVIYKELSADLTEIQPTPIAAKDVYDLSKAQVALQCHGSYISSRNLFWLDCWKNPAPGVPLNRVRVSQLADFYFPEGRQNNFFHKLLEVQVDSSGLTDKPSGLVVITPLEICHAIFLKAAADLSKPGATAACKALMEKLEGRKLSDQEVVQLLKNKHLMTAQKGTGHSAVDASNYCEWNFTAAKTIVTKLQSDQVITEIVNKQENLKGPDSCFNSLVKLENLAQRPSCLASRRFIFQLIDDLLCHGVIRDDDLSKKDMIGSANNPGAIHL
ncbi:Modification methylase HaeII (M.HaeII) (Cytosine-specific methyltransferase HaeII), partial [Durusdinium trenchii]